jgi:Helix-turn-helix domain
MRRRELPLSLEQRSELQRVRDTDRRAYLRECAAALLKIADGASAHWVANYGLHKPRPADTVYRWLDKYLAGGLENLVHRPRGHRGFSPSAR